MSGYNVRSSKETELELFFLIIKFLEGRPGCQNARKALEEEVQSNGLLPTTIDIHGGIRSQSLEELTSKYSHIADDTLLRICERLRDKQIAENPLGMVKVDSLLCLGRYSLLRNSTSLPHLPLDRIAARRRGFPISKLAGSLSIVQALESRRLGGGLQRKHFIWPKMYNRVQLLNQTVGHISSVYCVLFDRTGQYIFTGADDLLVKVWSTVTGRLLATLRGCSSEISDIAVNLENTMLAAGSLDRVVYVWCLQTTVLVARLSANVGMITGVNFCPLTCGDFRYLASTSSDGSVAFWFYVHQPIGKDTLFMRQPILFNEKMRPGVAQMICSSFSPGGAFLAAGSADHHVRVYYIPGSEGPQRIMEEEAHTDRVDSVQWANRGLRFVTGSKDGTTLIWRYSRQKWNFIKLDITAPLPGDPSNESSEEQQRQKPRVSMVCWDRSDKWIVTACHDASLKVWNSDTGALMRVLRNHRLDVFVLEPHPLDEGILLSAGHDGLLCIWDIRSGLCLLQHQNLIDGRGQSSFYDAKWSPDGTMIAATDAHGHILLFGFGAANAALKELPKQLFFNTDYWPLLRDEEAGILDETTREPPHMMAAPFLVDLEGNPYPPDIQRLVPGRELQDGSVPMLHSMSPSGNRENGVAAAYFPSADLASSRGNTPNAWQSRMLLPVLKPPEILQMFAFIEEKAKAEKLEYDRERRKPAAPLQRPAVVKPKVRKKRAPATTYKTRATAAEDSSQFVNPDALDMSQSSHSETSESSIDSDFSESSSSSEYSDWIADHGVSLEPPTRSRRRRPPARLSPSPTPRRQRTKEKEPKPDLKADSSESDEEHDPLKTEKLKEVPLEYVPPKWLSEVMPRKAPYYPQMGDHVMFFQEGYRLYLEAVRKKQVYKPSTRDPFSKLNLNEPEHVQVIGIKYEIRPPRLCCLKLAVMDSNGTMTNQTFNVKYHDVPDVIDFLVLKQTYDIAMSRNWKPGDRFRCVIDDAWWLGNIVSIKPNASFPDSPFLSLYTKWDNGEDEPMSPWDLEPVDPNNLPPEPGGCIDLLPEEALSLLYTPRADEWPDGDRDGVCDRLTAGFETVMTLSIAEPFCAPVDLNAYPTYAMYVEYPVDLSTIKARLENRFYRRLTGVQFDVRYLATNAEKFNVVHSQIVKQARIITELCLQVIRLVKEKSPLDVMSVYHQLREGYHSSSEDEQAVDVDDVPVRSAATSSTTHEHVNWRGDCDRLLRELSAHPDAEPFRQPVDLIEFPDYLKVVTCPMDLGTVREELMAGNFNTPKDFHEAVRLIFQNSRKYNTNRKSRIFGMSLRLSNLFEARMKKLVSEWKASRRRQIQKVTQTRRLRVGSRPGSSNENPVCGDDVVVDPMKSSEDEGDPQPGTSGVPPVRIVVSRPLPPESSDSDDDANLSTLRCTLKQPGSEDDRTRGAESSHESENKLKTTGSSDEGRGIKVNGHSTDQNEAENASPESYEEVPASKVNGVDRGRSSSESEDSLWNEGSSDENGEEEEDEESASSSQSGSESSNSSNTSYNKRRPGRRKVSTRSSRRAIPERSRRSKKLSESEDSLIENELANSSEEELSDTDSDVPIRSRNRSRVESESPPRRLRGRNVPRSTRKRRKESDDDASVSFSRKRRRKRGNSLSDSSMWQPSDSDNGRRKKRRSARLARTSESESEEEETLTAVSSRGRVRKITEKARAAFRRRRRR